MATPVQLHPKIRVRPKARLSASALADFIITTPDKQDDVLHDARYMRSSPVSHYADAIRSIKAYCEDPRRDFEVLDSAAAALKTKSESKEFKPSQQEDAKRCIEVIGRFTESVNVFGARSAPLLQAPPFELCNINGVSVSIQPDLIVGTAFPPPAKEAIGAVFIRLQKAPDPDACKTEETKVIRQEYRVELAKYMLVFPIVAREGDGYFIQAVEGGDESALVLNVETGDTRENILDRSEMLSYATHFVVAPKKRRAAIEFSHRGAKSQILALSIEQILRDHYPDLDNIGFSFAPVIRKNFITEINAFERIFWLSSCLSRQSLLATA
ncbi:hypothetical protein [Bradyrhizobium ottawaense]|uniref:hypothetical protein n=1 Tax=Bradyrhizobium ottawaense TaxID=931866 RepID=UPI0038328FDD